MRVNILHVEDDADLADVLKQSLEHLGFVGNILHAQSVEDAVRIIDATERLDIVFSDMNLTDGSGLDVIRHVRGHSVWGNTPVVVLSSDATPSKLGDAYALGANSYVLKAPRARSPFDVVKSLYNHWLKDVELPPLNPPGPSEVLRQLAKLRDRHSNIYLQLAQRFSDEPDSWLARALNQTNRSNLLRFLRAQLRPDHTFSPDLLAAVVESIRDHETRLATIERSLKQHPPATLEAAGALLLQLVELGDHAAQLRGVSLLFPISRLAAMALLTAGPRIPRSSRPGSMRTRARTSCTPGPRSFAIRRRYSNGKRRR